MHVREGESIQEWAIQGRDHVLIYLGILMPGTGSRLHICLMNEMVFTPLTDPSPYQSHSLIATSQFIMHPQPHWPLSFPWICTAPSCQNVWVSVAQSCPTLLPHGLEPTRLLCPWDFPGKMLEWVAISFSRALSWPRDWTQVSPTEGGFFTFTDSEAHLLPQGLCMHGPLSLQCFPHHLPHLFILQLTLQHHFLIQDSSSQD